MAQAQIAGAERSHVKASLLSEVKTIQAGHPFWVGIYLEMEPEWHTYWQNPGDSGGPTQITWNLPDGFRAIDINWPHPMRIETPPLVTYGYEDEVLLLVQMFPPDEISDSRSARFKAHVRWLECADVCIPGEAHLSLRKIIGNKPAKIDRKYSELFSKFKSKLPIEDSGWNVNATGNGKQIKLTLKSPDWFAGELGNVHFFPSNRGEIDSGSMRVVRNDVHELAILLSEASTSTQSIKNLSGVIVAEQGWRGPDSEQAIRINAEVGRFLSGAGVQALLLALLFAFIGGLLLNLMPCVLPVLFVKVLGLMKQSRAPIQQVRKHGVYYLVGVVASFWFLVGLLTVLRSAGNQLGWGFQLQSPVFVASMALFFHLFGLNLFGVFEFGTSFVRIEDLLKKKKSSMSENTYSFLTGVLATIVATPCTAPFMGSALGFALTQSIPISFLIFTFLALGMAIPYTVLTLNPNWIKYLPKPGPWMETFRQSMGFLMWGTAIWLIWVFGLQTGLNSLISLLVAMFLVGMAAWIWGRWGVPTKPRQVRVRSGIIALLLVIFGLYFGISSPFTYKSNVSSSIPSDSEIKWEEFTTEKVEQLKSEGIPYFIDFTAAWCLTCQVNKKVAFADSDVVNRFKETKIVALRADWTKYNSEITKALQNLGRNGVPVYVLYDGNAEKKIDLLPEVLTPGIVLKALSKL